MHFIKLAAAGVCACGVLMTATAAWAAPANFKTIKPQEAKVMMQKGDVVILDVRTPKEFADGHIAGAVNVPLQSMKVGQRLDMVKSDDQTILVYCKSGRRAQLASDILSFSGYKNVYNFLGIKQWPYGLTK